MFRQCFEIIIKFLKKIKKRFKSEYHEVSIGIPPEQTQWDVDEDEIPLYLQITEWEPTGIPDGSLVKQDVGHHTPESVDFVFCYYKYPNRTKICKSKECSCFFKGGMYPCRCRNPQHYATDALPFLFRKSSRDLMRYFPYGRARSDGTYLHIARRVGYADITEHVEPVTVSSPQYLI